MKEENNRLEGSKRTSTNKKVGGRGDDKLYLLRLSSSFFHENLQLR